jgi:hypothetical protein
MRELIRTLMFASGGPMLRIALALTLTSCLLLPGSVLADPAYPDYPDDDLGRVSRPAGILRTAYDTVALRPFGLVQVAAGAAAFMTFYLPALVVNGDDDVTRACITDPVDQTFRKPLGDL